MVARWISALDTFDFESTHRKGSLHGNTDALSRIPRRKCKRIDCPQCQSRANISDCMVSVITRSKNEQSDTTTVNVNNEKQGTDAHVSNASDDGINRIITESNWIQQWTKEDLVNHQNNYETLLRTVINLFRSNNMKSEIRSSNQELRALLRQWGLLKIVDNLLCRTWDNEDGTSSLQFIAPKTLRLQIMQQIHNCRTAGHLARDKTLNRIRARFYWPGMSSDVERWCQTCLLCQKGNQGGRWNITYATCNGLWSYGVCDNRYNGSSTNHR